MTWTATRHAVFALIVSGWGLSACQTTPSAPPAQPAPAPAPAAATPPEPPKPITLEAARNLANNCFTCHGPAGRSPGAIPSIHTKSADAIVEKLIKFRSGTEPSTVMGRHAKGYTDAEIEAVANYIAGLRK